MSKDLRIILRFAVAGIAIAAACSVLVKLAEPLGESTKLIWAVAASVILCPGFIVFVWAASVEMQIPSFAVMWLIIGLINFVVYAALGAVYVRFRNWRAGTARI